MDINFFFNQDFNQDFSQVFNTYLIYFQTEFFEYLKELKNLFSSVIMPDMPNLIKIN